MILLSLGPKTMCSGHLNVKVHDMLCGCQSWAFVPQNLHASATCAKRAVVHDGTPRKHPILAVCVCWSSPCAAELV